MDEIRKFFLVSLSEKMNIFFGMQNIDICKFFMTFFNLIKIQHAKKTSWLHQWAAKADTNAGETKINP